MTLQVSSEKCKTASKVYQRMDSLTKTLKELRDISSNQIEWPRLSHRKSFNPEDPKDLHTQILETMLYQLGYIQAYNPTSMKLKEVMDHLRNLIHNHNNNQQISIEHLNQLLLNE